MIMIFIKAIIFITLSNSEKCLGFIDTEDSGNLSEGTNTDSPSHELLVSDLDYYVNTEEGITELKKEFNSIKNGQRKSWIEASMPENRKKNRYENVRAYDWNRVHLFTSEEDDSDYINANYINGTNAEREYIATQGPLPNTIDDFWNMVWHQNSTKIVMLANLFEHNESKVAKYWPETSSKYGSIDVSTVSEFSLSAIHLHIRKFSIQKEGMSLPRIVHHFHFTGWPDLGVPKDRISVVTLMHLVRTYNVDSKSPIIIHCSAGIGRSGTVILMDSMMQLAQREGVVDFPKRLDQMRVQRVDMVEKEDQYVYAQQAVYDRMTSDTFEDFLSDMLHQFQKKMENAS